jgi:hypothetical protein
LSAKRPIAAEATSADKSLLVFYTKYAFLNDSCVPNIGLTVSATLCFSEPRLYEPETGGKVAGHAGC